MHLRGSIFLRRNIFLKTNSDFVKMKAKIKYETWYDIIKKNDDL